MVSPEPVRRTAEIEELTNSYVIHPIAGRLTQLLAVLNVSPNVVSLAGMGCGVSAGFAYFHYRHSVAAVTGFLLMVAWHVLDGADGQLARLTQKQSHTGKILDGVCDYVTFASVYIGLALAISQDHGSWVWGVVALAGICHAVQAAAYEAQRQDYEFWGLGKNVAKTPASDTQTPAGSPVGFVGGRLYRMYSQLQSLATGVHRQSRDRLTAVMAASTHGPDAIRGCYREVFAPSVRRWSVMSANYRTLAIFFFAIIGAPLYYFLFEIFGLSALLAILLSRQNGRYDAFFRELGGLNQIVYSTATAGQ